jgi:hypothetical protein
LYIILLLVALLPFAASRIWLIMSVLLLYFMAFPKNGLWC